MVEVPIAVFQVNYLSFRTIFNSVKIIDGWRVLSVPCVRGRKYRKLHATCRLERFDHANHCRQLRGCPRPARVHSEQAVQKVDGLLKLSFIYRSLVHVNCPSKFELPPRERTGRLRLFHKQCPGSLPFIAVLEVCRAAHLTHTAPTKRKLLDSKRNRVLSTHQIATREPQRKMTPLQCSGVPRPVSYTHL